ncbi:PREDICTED: transcription factor Adf-1-like, partial [Rhagoletis zephyria]|uniref:transcription factor Adf-1-like n=1 Tax=Rhagoletis zephyria TaxID=28612 RepID=UPI000811829D
MIDEERLIDLVRDNEVLYNKTYVGYRLPAKKLAAWAAISRELSATEEQCTKRWISLRERYTRELRKLDAPSGSAPASQPTWHFSTNMAFLKPFTAPRPMIDEERLIDLVRDNEVLYNKTCVGYRLPAKKLAAWAAISRELGATDLCKDP